MTISVFKTVRTDIAYKNLYRCDSIIGDLLRRNPVDTNSLPLLEQVEMKSKESKSHEFSIATCPIMGRIADMIYFDSRDSFKCRLKSSVIIGIANCSDTSKLNNWFSKKECNIVDGNFHFKWLLSYEDKNEAYLVGLKSESPALYLTYSDVSEIKLTPNKGILQKLDLFTGDKTPISSYSFDIVFKPSIIASFKKIMIEDSSCSYLACIRAGERNYYYPIDRNNLLKSNTFETVTEVRTEDVRQFIKASSLDISVIKD